MAYYTGGANSFADLVTAIKNAVALNGWTVTDNILEKGTSFIEILSSASELTLRGGTARSGSTLAGELQPWRVRMCSPFGGVAVNFPVSYEIFLHTDPDEVYCVINYNSAYYQFCAFGKSDVPGLPGTGCFVAASSEAGLTNFNISPTTGGAHQVSQGAAGFFWHGGYSQGNRGNSSIHHGYATGGGQTTGWSASDHTDAWKTTFIEAGGVKVSNQPNTFNNGTLLIDYKVWRTSPSSGRILVADFAHIRAMRIDYYNPGETITLGSDVWKVFPWFIKNSDVRNGGTNVSGTIGFAVRMVE